MIILSIYDFSFKTIDGKEKSLSEFKGKNLLIVNTASKCGFTPQYKDLEVLYQKFKNDDFEIIGFPCNQFGEQEPGNSSEIKNFCEINYGVNFTITEKVDVNGSSAHPLFTYLKENTKFEGLDTTTPSGKLLHTFLKEKFPESLLGDSIKWNFTKFLIDKDGQIVKRFESTFEPLDIEPYITAAK